MIFQLCFESKIVVGLLQIVDMLNKPVTPPVIARGAKKLEHPLCPLGEWA